MGWSVLHEQIAVMKDILSLLNHHAQCLFLVHFILSVCVGKASARSTDHEDPWSFIRTASKVMKKQTLRI